MSEDLGITVKKDTDISEWYQQTVIKGGFADYTPVKGMIVYRPNGYRVWELIMGEFDPILKAHGVQNVLFPLLIPENLLTREADHFAGFTPEVFWVTRGGDQPLEEKLALRPTSETIIHTMWGKWLQSHRDLPVRFNQWCTVYRHETKMTKPFIRGREVLWSETHTAHATKQEAEKETEWAINAYGDLVERILAVPVVRGRKTDSDKFAGAEYTLGIEALMPDGKALQSGTSHLLSHKFAEAFGVKFVNEDKKWTHAWMTSYGLSMRVIGGMLMIHGDDKGAVLPPKVAPVQVVIVPIVFKEKEKIVNDATGKIHSELKKTGLRVVLDDREGYTAGWKFNDWEMQGVPLRLEVGPRDVEAKSVMLVRRDTGQKIKVPFEKLKATVKKELDRLHARLFSKARESLVQKTVNATRMGEVKKAVEDQKWALAPYCGNVACEAKMKVETGAEPRLIPFGQKLLKDTRCVACGEEATDLVYWGKSY